MTLQAQAEFVQNFCVCMNCNIPECGYDTRMKTKRAIHKTTHQLNMLTQRRAAAERAVGPHARVGRTRQQFWVGVLLKLSSVNDIVTAVYPICQSCRLTQLASANPTNFRPHVDLQPFLTTAVIEGMIVFLTSHFNFVRGQNFG